MSRFSPLSSSSCFLMTAGCCGGDCIGIPLSVGECGRGKMGGGPDQLASRGLFALDRIRPPAKHIKATCLSPSTTKCSCPPFLASSGTLVIQIYQYTSSQPFHFSAWFAFLLPCYSTFKVLSHQPVSEPDIQKWAMYWSVIGAFVAFEYLAEWLISWQVIFPPLAPCDHLTLALLPSRLPFYWELKTAFLLFLSLPQTQVGAVSHRLRDFVLTSLSSAIGVNLHLHDLPSTILRTQ